MKRKKYERFRPLGCTNTINEVNNTEIHYDAGNYLAIGFTGRANKPLFYSRYYSYDQMMYDIEYHLSRIMERCEEKEARKREAAELLVKTNIGDVFISQWGYEQTNVDFYEVIRISGKSITFRKIEKETVRFVDSMQKYVKPMPGKFCGDAFRKVVKNRAYITISSYKGMKLWKGDNALQTSYG